MSNKGSKSREYDLMLLTITSKNEVHVNINKNLVMAFKNSKDVNATKDTMLKVVGETLDGVIKNLEKF